MWDKMLCNNMLLVLEVGIYIKLEKLYPQNITESTKSISVPYLSKNTSNKMKIIIIFSLTIAVLVEAISDEQQWVSFKLNHGKVYRDTLDDTLRFGIFQSNLRRIEEHNRKYANGQSSYQMGINQFADITREEFLQKLNLQKKNKPTFIEGKSYFVKDSNDELPKSFNWTEKGAVTAVKNQGSCGSCWSFSVTGSIEGQLFITTKKLSSLSEQNLVDCTPDCFGCQGGLLDKAMEYVKTNGIMGSDQYPYTARDGVCVYNSSEIVVKISSYVHIKPNDEEDLQHAVTKVGPVSVAIDASGFQFYKSGIYDDQVYCGNSQWNLNHGVLAVGYGLTDGKYYWIVKNSWGRLWGENGYIRMTRNADNQCGIATDALYPLL